MLVHRLSHNSHFVVIVVKQSNSITMAYIFYSGEDPIAKELIGETYGPEKIWF